MQIPSRTEISGLVLAGGRATRMGGIDKGLADYRGRTLIEHVIERLRPQVAGMLISANRNLERYRAFGVPVLPDDEAGPEPFAGPLAGMLAGMRACPTRWLAVVPCDAPLLPNNLVSHLAETLVVQRAAAACVGNRIEPMFCLLHIGLADDLAQTLAQGERRAETWLRRIGAVPAAFKHDAAFANFNTLQQLRARDDEH